MVTMRAAPEVEDWVCQVSVDHEDQHTRHSVTVTRTDFERWAGGAKREDVESLVARSFPSRARTTDAILATFDLTVIQRYFPEYDAAFKR
ncbi:MAG: hypothetical protein NVS1B3_05310 [Candidatus Dormibacteraceae bacterium]